MMRAETCLGLLCYFATVLSQKNLEHIGKQFENQGSNNEKSPLCMAGKCAGISYKEIQRLYRGLFFTKEELLEKIIKTKIYTKRRQEKMCWKMDKLKKKPKTKRDTCGYSNLNSTHDGDSCCPTSISAMCTTSMINTSGVRRMVVHFPDMTPDPMYQYIPIGLCHFRGSCTTCQQEYALLNILVIDETFNSYPYLEFDEFYVKSYCSCKG